MTFHVPEEGKFNRPGGGLCCDSILSLIGSNFIFLWFLGMVMYDNMLMKTEENKI